MVDPIGHAELVTGRKQSVVCDLWSKSGFAAAISDVTGPHVYNYGDLPFATLAITLYDVRRHVLIENGRVRRDGRVSAGRFRIGQPGRSVIVDAVPDVRLGKLMLLYLGAPLLRAVGEARGLSAPVELADTTWDVADPLLSMSAFRLVEASETGTLPNALLAEQLAYTLALHVTDSYGVAARARPAERPDLDRRMHERVIEFVQSDPAADITLSDLARIAGLSPAGFIRSFKRATGVTPHRFVVEQRIRAARQLLSASDLPIAEIALSVGFSSQSHFGAAFRAITGVTPARYRRN